MDHCVMFRANAIIRGLMDRDDMANLGLGDVVDPSSPPASTQPITAFPSNPPHVPQPPPSEHRI